MATPQRQAAIQKEGRLELALQAYQKNQFLTPTAAAKAYDVPRKTLQRRITGISSRLGSISKKRLLTPTEEESLIQWILSMNQRSMPPRIAIVQGMAHLLVAQRQQSTIQPTVGENWVQRFINCHDSIKSKYNRKYDYQRAKCEDPELIQA